MLRFIACLIFLVCPTYGLATTPDELRDLVRAEDRAGVKEVLETAQAEFLAGERNADDIRSLFIALSRSHPQTIGFVEAWADAEPRNPMAQIARAWSLYGMAGRIERGGGGYSNKVAAEIYREVRERATHAYQMDPDLIPASDAMVRRLGTGALAPHPMQALERVMTRHPNWGSLQRSTFIIPYMEVSEVEAYCAYFGSKGDEGRRDLTHRCKFYLASLHFADQFEPFLTEHLGDDSDPMLETARLDFLSRLLMPCTLSEAQVAWAEEAFMAHMATSGGDMFKLAHLYGIAKRFEARIAPSHLRFTFLHEFKKKHLALAERFLEDDPYNLTLLEMVEGVAFEPEYQTVALGEGRYETSPIPVKRTDEELADFHAARRAHEMEMKESRLHASPFSSSYWSDFGKAKARLKPENLFLGDLALQNAVAYADEPIQPIRAILSAKIQQFTVLRDVRDAYDDAPGNWKRLCDETDLARDVMCPFLRAFRVRDALCRFNPTMKNNCYAIDVEAEDAYTLLSQIAGDEPACADIKNAPITGLWYTPISFEEAMAGRLFDN